MANRMTPFRFAGWGSEVPTTVMDNALLEQHFGVDEGWILEKTGIRERRIAALHESTATLATMIPATANPSAGRRDVVAGRARAAASVAWNAGAAAASSRRSA